MDRHWAFLLLLSTFVHLSSCEDIVTGNVSGSSEVESSRESLPEDISVNVTITGEDVRLDLKLDRNASTDIPVYVFSRNKDGQLDTERINRKIQKHFAVYRDVTQGAVFSVRRDVETGHGHLTLEGVVHVKGKVYDLKSAKRRHRKSTDPTTEGKTGSVGHDVKRRDVNGDEVENNQSEAADNHEFVVRPLDDLPSRSLRGDAIVPLLGGAMCAATSLQKKTQVKRLNGDDVQQPASLSAPAAPISEQLSVLHDVYIDVIAVADYGVFSNWYANSSGLTEEEKTQDVLSRLPEYYAFLFSGVNMIYESITSLPYRIHIKMSSLMIATNPAASLWTESLRVKTSPRDHVNSDTALDSFAKWVASTDLVTNCDHLTLFSGYDLWGTEKDDLGVTYMTTMCKTNGLSVSLVEDLRNFGTTSVLAHEIGHSLSSEHDQEKNECPKDDHYIMASGYDPRGASNWHNLWKFSNCSIRYFRTFISETVQSTRGHQCLYNNITSNKYIPDVSGQQPGQVYDHDAQCRQIFGPSSRLCRGAEFYKSPQEVCMNLQCDDVAPVTNCWYFVAARGTSCGHHKWCVNGDCVYDTRAPAMGENCPFGDLPGVVWFLNQTCAELIASHPGYCYDSYYFGRCCASCAKYSRPVRGKMCEDEDCQYGDKVTGCVNSQCYTWRPSYLADCCETCSFVSSTTNKSTTTTSNRFTIVNSTTRKTTSPTLPTLYGTTANTLCIDTPGRVYGKTCAERVAERPALCYHPDILGCCASCRAHSNGVKGCEYGDRIPSECPHMVSQPCDARLEELCCQSCANLGDDHSTTPRSSAVQWTELVTSAFIGCLSVNLLRI